MTSAADPPAWVLRRRYRDSRRGERCRVCGHRRTIATEAGFYCKPHADALPQRIARHDEDDPTSAPIGAEVAHDHDQDDEHMDDINEAERKVDLARARLRATRRGANLTDGAAIIEAEQGLQRALAALAAAWTARLVRDEGDAA